MPPRTTVRAKSTLTSRTACRMPPRTTVRDLSRLWLLCQKLREKTWGQGNFRLMPLLQTLQGRSRTSKGLKNIHTARYFVSACPAFRWDTRSLFCAPRGIPGWSRAHTIRDESRSGPDTIAAVHRPSLSCVGTERTLPSGMSRLTKKTPPVPNKSGASQCQERRMTGGIIHSVDPETSLKQRAPRLQTVSFLPALTGKRKERRTSVRRSVADCLSAGCFRLLWGRRKHIRRRKEG